MRTDELKKTLCAAFCGEVAVNVVPSGYAISSAFSDNSGDQIGFYLTPVDDGFQIEDDGSYLAHLVAKDIPIDQGARGQLLDAILSQTHAYWDRETLEIRTDVFPAEQISRRAIDFLSGMIRIRDLELLTREVVRSTFREDAINALTETIGHAANLREGEEIAKEFREFPADLIVRPRAVAPQAKPAAIYFVNSNEKLSEALLLKMEAEKLARKDFEVIALIDDVRQINGRRFQRAQNRGLAMPIFREDEDGAMTYIRRALGIPGKSAA